jgi:hypothetical protein
MNISSEALNSDRSKLTALRVQQVEAASHSSEDEMDYKFDSVS